jgi:hypothetical protein
MWANSVWGLFGLGITFLLARISMIWSTGHEEWGPRFICAAIICYIINSCCNSYCSTTLATVAAYFSRSRDTGESCMLGRLLDLVLRRNNNEAAGCKLDTVLPDTSNA